MVLPVLSLKPPVLRFAAFHRPQAQGKWFLCLPVALIGNGPDFRNSRNQHYL
jgi:hypothetical protein